MRAGTSGRLAILDAAECPPTFGTDPEMVQVDCGRGKDALSIAKEDMEDHKTEGILEAENRITEKDSVIGLSASGQAPHIIGCRRSQATGLYYIHNLQ